MIKVSVVGAKGRMGSHVVDAVNGAQDMELALTLDAGDDLHAITSENTDVVVEFTVPSVTLDNVLTLIGQGVDVVVGTTGWTEDRLEQVRQALAAAPRADQAVFIAPNFAISAVLAAPVPDNTETDGGSRGQVVDGIHVHAVRLRGLNAHEEVLMGNAGEQLTIRADSFDRISFMPGVLLAVRKLAEGSHAGLTVGLDRFLDL